MESKPVGSYPSQEKIEAYLVDIHPSTNKKACPHDERILKIAAERFADKSIDPSKIANEVKKIFEEDMYKGSTEMLVRNITRALNDFATGFDPNNTKLHFPSEEKILTYLEANLPCELLKPGLTKALAKNFADIGIEHKDIDKMIFKTLHDQGYDLRSMTTAAITVFIEKVLEDLLIAECKKFLESENEKYQKYFKEL